ncbi:MAG: adenine deaminase [Bacteroidetes bacterium]|nr:adenine deaminase [Bacteroidota bacterium]
MSTFSISGQLIDLFQKRTYPALIEIAGGVIRSVKEIDNAPDQYILPGFVDAHIHIESSMLVPTAFARLAVVHGTVATVSDPHEIANVCGKEGVQYMIENSRQTPFKFFFGAPSCVPATTFETAGAALDANDVADLLQSPDIWYLSEMMNYPGVLNNDPQVMAKIAAAKKAGKPVDGHAPGLRGDTAKAYAAAGITTDHECFTLEEALDKIAAGMHILIREGSAAKNFEALAEIIRLHPDKVMFCSDDKHPDELVLHHINKLVKRAIDKGYDMYDVLRAACLHPVQHYKLPVGLLRENDPADFIVVKDLGEWTIHQTYINGELVAENGQTLLSHKQAPVINNFSAQPKVIHDFEVKTEKDRSDIRVIEALEGQLITNELIKPGKIKDGILISDPDQDILKIAVVNRYVPDAPVALAFIKNFGLKQGAIASTVAHDCHNIIAVGIDDTSICAAVNALIECKGGVAVANGVTVDCMALPIAGLMSIDDGYWVARQYSELDKKAKELGTPLKAPFMTLSFMALLVIPSLKLSDKGLFDGNAFRFTSLTV